MNRDQLKEIIKTLTTEVLEEISTGNVGMGLDPKQTKDQQDELDRMTAAERKQIEVARKEQEKLTNDIRRIEGAIQKLKEPLERKIRTLEKAKSSKQRKLGTITSKITNIQRKYSKV